MTREKIEKKTSCHLGPDRPSALLFLDGEKSIGVRAIFTKRTTFIYYFVFLTL